MSGPYFSSRDQDEYDALQMSLKSLEWQTQDHPVDCDCVFCEARERRRADENDEPETPTMPKIETPGMFRERIAECFMVGETGHLAFQEGGKERIDAMIAERDAAIRAESAELLRVCGEALKALVSSIGGDFEMCQCKNCIAVRQAKSALAALKKAGVGV